MFIFYEKLYNTDKLKTLIFSSFIVELAKVQIK